MDSEQLKRAIDRLNAEIEKRYDDLYDESTETYPKTPEYLKEVNQARGDLEIAICKIADLLDLDDIFTC